MRCRWISRKVAGPKGFSGESAAHKGNATGGSAGTDKINRSHLLTLGAWIEQNHVQMRREGRRVLNVGERTLQTKFIAEAIELLHLILELDFAPQKIAESTQGDGGAERDAKLFS